MNAILRGLGPAIFKAKAMCGFGLMLALAPAAYAEIAQSPLLLGGGNIPGNLVLTPSAEYPTVISVANLGEYSLNATYAGYFDSDKCYEYEEDDIDNHLIFGKVKEKDGAGYFKPKNFDFRGKGTCDGDWSGHYLNWAATQTIDPFRKALTGGYRAVDEKDKTILEKATRANRNESFADRRVLAAVKGSDNVLIKRITPYKDSVRLVSSVSSGSSYQKNKTLKIIGEEEKIKNNGKIEITKTEKYYSVRVEVCKKDLLEDNCKQYGDHYKPEGLLQEYADDIRYSVFSYLNVDGNKVNGGVLRAPQDYIGVNKRTPGTPGVSDNTFKEWDPKTGVLYNNPRNDSTGNSGVINYINKFGEKSNQHKSNDPVSELYYAAIRYLRGKGNIADYTSQADTDLKKDYFPVVTQWVDPIQYSCQKNAILGIGDTNTHEDRNLLPSDDNSFMDTEGLSNYTNKVLGLEGATQSAPGTFTGRGNSAYIAGLAYFANTQDIRPDLTGKQTVSTYWVDVRENQVLQGRKTNQYWLAAKYGGFKVPNSYSYGQSLQDAWWHTPGDILSTGDKRPNNFYVASDAEAMVESLRQAFAQIASYGQGTTTALAASSTRLEEGSAFFQSSVNSTYWSGDLLGLPVKIDNVSAGSSWSAAAKMDALSAEKIKNRNILSIKSVDGQQVLTSGITFNWGQLSSAQRTQLKDQDILDFLRGDRTKELTTAQASGKFRERSSRLGDIVNSDPQFVHQKNNGYTRLTHWDNGVAKKYAEFRDSNAYKARVPMVIVGANDGMLHAFDARLDANGGKELFAFVPNAVYDNLSELADTNYTHRYYVDGTPRVADAWLGNRWATVAVGVSGGGGKSVFALDITNVTDSSSVKPSNVMWEFTHPAMGYQMGQPALVALPNQKFGVVVSSGYHESAPTEGYVWVLDASNGSILKEFKLTTTGNLGGVLAADLNGDMQVDRFYAADTQGHVWRMDLKTDKPANWKIPGTLNNDALFKVVDLQGQPQAITAPLAFTVNKRGQPMLLFGTGSFYRVGDNDIPKDPPVETLYGLFDVGVQLVGRTDLLKQEIVAQQTRDGKVLRAVSTNKLKSQQGWYLDLAWLSGKNATGAQGERVLAKASSRIDRVVFTTMTPAEDPCSAGGTSMIMALDLSSGMSLAYDYLGVGTNAEDRIWSGVLDPGLGVIKGVLAAKGKLAYVGSAASGGATSIMKDVLEEAIYPTMQSWRQVR